MLEAAGLPDGEGPDHWLARFTPKGVAPGDYRLVVTMTGDDGSSRRSEIDLVVEG